MVRDLNEAIARRAGGGEELDAEPMSNGGLAPDLQSLAHFYRLGDEG